MTERHLVSAEDGVPLALTVVRLPQPAPVVLLRTPYGRDQHLPEAMGWAARGFACVLGDVRGRFDSGGEFLPYLNERADGVATLEWVRRQGFCDGRVVLAGASYAAYCAIATAVAVPVAGVIASVPAMGLGETAREPGGAARLACRVGWWTEHGDTARPRHPAPDTTRVLGELPVRQLPGRLLGRELRGWDQLWAAPARGPLWDELGALDIPLLAVGGLDDPFAAETVELAQVWGGPTRLVLGPWGHSLDAENPGAALGGQRIGELYAAWAAAACAGTLTGAGAWISLRADRWRSWPKTAVTCPLVVEQGDFTADPAAPFPSRPPGADLTADADRIDRAVLHSAPLPGGELCGSVLVRFRVRADAADADWVLRLSADSRQLGHAVLRHRQPPGAVSELTALIGPVGAVLPTGTRLKLEVAGHHWPRHARNPHTGVDPVDAVDLRPSRREVLHADLELPWSSGGAVAADLLIKEVVR